MRDSKMVKPVTPANFLTIGYLKSIKDVNTNLTYPYIHVTPLSYKFLEPKDIYESNPNKIQVNIGSINGMDSLRFSNELNGAEDPNQDIYEHYKNCIFIIRPSFSGYGPHTEIVGKNKSVAAYDMTGYDFDVTKTYTPVPIFSAKTSRMYHITNRSQFENALNNRQVVGRIITAPWPTDSSCFPDAIMWESSDHVYYLYTGLSVQSVKPTYYDDPQIDYGGYVEDVSYGFVDEANIVRKFSHDELTQDGYIYHNGIVFLDDSLFDNFMTYDSVNNITKNGDPYKREGASLHSPLAVGNLVPNKRQIRRERDKENKEASKKANKEMTQKDQKASDSHQYNIDFIHKLEHLAYQKGLLYNKKDLINFHAAMKSDGLVVLAGFSGTGKSSLIDLYAKALGLDRDVDSKGSYIKADHSRFNFIPVRPFWNDDSDLLGYVDTIHDVYHPGDSGLVDTLAEAAKPENQDKLYLVSFDEMNLARVEYYFSQFLAVMERNPDDRYIKLYNPSIADSLNNSDKYPPTIKVGQNVLFVGTINLDGSTYKLSDKVLDRANVIHLELRPYFAGKHDRDIDTTGNRFMNRPVTYHEFSVMKGGSSDNGLTDHDLHLLWKLHTALHHADYNLGIGWRIIKQVNEYLRNVPEMPSEEAGLSRNEAIDLQIAQRILTKVRGSDADVLELLSPDRTDGNDNLINILDQYADVSDFKHSKQMIFRKYQEVKKYGFTL